MKVRVLKNARSQSGLFVFAVVYNEEWFLPHFLAHHRALGVERFVFFDDFSTDSTVELLMAQPDCMVLTHADEPDPDRLVASLQKLLTNFIPETVGKGAWSLVLDADEFLILPPAFATMDELIRYLERHDAHSAFAAMIDFYPRTVADRFYDPLPPLLGSPWFDPQLGFERIPGRKHPRSLPVGVRVRLLRKLKVRHPDVFDAIYGNLKYGFAALWKVPLLKTGIGIQRPDPHSISEPTPDHIQLALAHFRFYPDLDRRVRDSIERQSHFLGSVEYRFMAAVLELFPNEPLLFPASVRYQSPADLERVGLIWSK